jgi:hypothetical protein
MHGMNELCSSDRRFDLSEAHKMNITHVIFKGMMDVIKVDGTVDVPIPRTFTSDKQHTGVSAKV